MQERWPPWRRASTLLTPSAFSAMGRILRRFVGGSRLCAPRRVGGTGVKGATAWQDLIWKIEWAQKNKLDAIGKYMNWEWLFSKYVKLQSFNLTLSKILACRHPKAKHPLSICLGLTAPLHAGGSGSPLSHSSAPRAKPPMLQRWLLTGLSCFLGHAFPAAKEEGTINALERQPLIPGFKFVVGCLFLGGTFCHFYAWWPECYDMLAVSPCFFAQAAVLTKTAHVPAAPLSTSCSRSFSIASCCGCFFPHVQKGACP